jgi:LmbE family N-acetylglucosaminyl deacetylase
MLKGIQTQPESSTRMLRLLCVTAHPDDEAGSFGGTLLLYRARNVETYVICLTPGQAATHRGNARSDEELSAIRRQEFARACEILQITRGEVLDFRDGALETAPAATVTESLVERIREIRPQVIITYGGEGAVTAHPDHSMAGVFASLAFHWAGRTNRFPGQLTNGMKPYRPQKLYYSTADFSLPDRQPIATAPASATIEVGEHFATKVRAFKQHVSQAPLFDLFERNVSRRGTREMFHLVATRDFQETRTENDLFEGVVDD